MILIATGIVVGALILPPDARAIADSRRDAAYVRILEAGPTAPRFDEALDSLTYNRVILGQDWSGDHASNPWTHCHHNRVMWPAQVATRKLVGSPWGSTPEHRRRLLELMASTGNSWLDSLDVLACLATDDTRLPYQSLAILCDRRTAHLLATRYDKIRHHSDLRAYDGELTDIIRCLYHQTSFARETATALRAGESDPTLQAELDRVIAHWPVPVDTQARPGGSVSPRP